MALSGSTVFEVRTTGSDTNGGGFVAGASGTDWSQQASAQYSVTDGVTAGSTTITSATANFGSDVVGNLAYVAGGTGSVTPGWYQITAWTNATTITVDRSTGLTAGTGVTLRIGGCFATPGQAASLMTVANMAAWVKAGTYTMTTATPGPGGPVSLTNPATSFFFGYDSTRGDRTGTRPVLAWGAVSAPGSVSYLYTSGSGARHVVANFAVDGGGTTNVAGIKLDTLNVAEECVASNCSASSCFGFTGLAVVCGCSAASCATGFSGMASISESVASSCTTGFTGIASVVECLAYNCTTGLTSSSNSQLYRRCTADTCTNGFSVTGTANFDSCLASNCSTAGFSLNSSLHAVLNCAGYNNTTQVTNSPTLNLNFTTLTADPYVNQVSADFRPNSTSGAGASLRGAALHVLGQAATTDIGAVQHSDPAGGGILIRPGMLGGFRQ